MTVEVTLLSGSEKLRLREVFVSVQDSGSLSGYIRTYGINSRSVSKLESFIMENGLLDRVEGNANVHRWSEQTQLEKGDNITVGYMSELSEYTRIIPESVADIDNLYNKEIKNRGQFRAVTQWGNETKQSFYAYNCFTFGELDLVPTVEEYTVLLRCPRFQCDRIYSLASCVLTFGKKLMTITGMSEQRIMARIKEKGESKCIPWGALKDLIQTHPDEAKRVDIFALSLYGLMVFPKALGYVDEAATDLFHQLSKRVTSVPAILAETFRSLNTCRRASAGRFVFFEDYSSLKDIAASTKRVDVPQKNWIVLLQNLQSKDVEWRAPWMVPGEIIYRCDSFDWVPLLGIWGAIGYAPLLVLRQHGLRQFIPTTYGLVQSEFVYRGADYKRKVNKISSAWNKTCRLKGVAINPTTTSGYVEWRGRRINDNIPRPSVEGTRPMEEYLQVMPSELEIMKQEFERKNLELEKRIAKLKEEKIYLSLDVDVQKREVEKERKGKKKIEEDRDDLKEHYKMAQVSLRSENRRVFRSVAERGPRGKVQSRILGEESKEQVRDRDYLIEEAIIQIREVAKHVRDLAVRADVLTMMHESSSDVGRELALLLDRVKTLGIRPKAYL
ncbi:hypothetical protein CXB51_035757 [Gossypium anomalum]|uniref:DUF7745 domain-containing protein n=1 Tax=Gossypium anomalum TaxID=47600 RepID=A0A8J5XP92_9ROSI|nr:hypothetical protein CXB51_035757 [Gossypium anomalum]